MEQLPTFNQITKWSSQADITIKGHQLQDLVNLANLVRPLVIAVDQIIQQAVIDGKATTEFVDENGNIVDPEVVKQVYDSLKPTPTPPVN